LDSTTNMFESSVGQKVVYAPTTERLFGNGNGKKWELTAWE